MSCIETENQFLRAKEALIASYNSKQTNQSARLIGLIVALFALLQAINNVSPNGSLTISVNVGNTTQIQVPVEGLLEFFSILFLVTVIIYTLVRYSVHAEFSQQLLSITQRDVAENSEEGSPLHSAIERAVWIKTKASNLHVFVIFPLNWFVTTQEQRSGLKAGAISLIAAFPPTLLLILIIQ